MSTSGKFSTVDPGEIERFNQLAETWWNPSGPMWPLHRLNALRAPFVIDSISRHFNLETQGASHLQGLTVLDIGCGVGLLSEAMAAQGAHVTGVDPAERNIEMARRHADQRNFNIEYLPGTVDVVAERRFDVVLNMEVVEHVDHLAEFMRSCCALVKPGGMQFVATINRNLLSFLVAIVGAEYVLRWLPRGTHQWSKFVRPREVSSMLNEGGLTVVEKRGVSINPFTREYRLTRSTRVNYMLVAGAR